MQLTCPLSKEREENKTGPAEIPGWETWNKLLRTGIFFPTNRSALHALAWKHCEWVLMVSHRSYRSRYRRPNSMPPKNGGPCSELLSMVASRDLVFSWPCSAAKLRLRDGAKLRCLIVRRERHLWGSAEIRLKKGSRGFTKEIFERQDVSSK
jgi:hypothetical protein